MTAQRATPFTQAVHNSAAGSNPQPGWVDVVATADADAVAAAVDAGERGLELQPLGLPPAFRGHGHLLLLHVIHPRPSSDSPHRLLNGIQTGPPFGTSLGAEVVPGNWTGC